MTLNCNTQIFGDKIYHFSYLFSFLHIFLNFVRYSTKVLCIPMRKKSMRKGNRMLFISDKNCDHLIKTNPPSFAMITLKASGLLTSLLLS